MSLASDFQVMKKTGKDQKEVQHVRKISVYFRPLPEAVRDLEETRRLQNVLNPHGNAVLNRVSSDSLIRSFEKEYADDVVGALRQFAGVNAANTEGAGTSSVKKRKERDKGDEGNVSKRMRLAF